jgi:hypothetical protein
LGEDVTIAEGSKMSKWQRKAMIPDMIKVWSTIILILLPSFYAIYAGAPLVIEEIKKKVQELKDRIDAKLSQIELVDTEGMTVEERTEADTQLKQIEEEENLWAAENKDVHELKQYLERMLARGQRELKPLSEVKSSIWLNAVDEPIHKLMCGWHKKYFGFEKILRDGIAPVSHGICPDCTLLMEEELEHPNEPSK